MTLGAGGGVRDDDTRSILHDAKITLCVMWRMGSFQKRDSCKFIELIKL